MADARGRGIAAALAHGVLAAAHAAPPGTRHETRLRWPGESGPDTVAVFAIRPADWTRGVVPPEPGYDGPARAEAPITLTTDDGLRLIGELALPEHRDPAATLVCLHPLPTHGGMMDSHVYRKAANRLPALADVAVLRFNTRGTESEQGKSEGEFGGGETERFDVAAAVRYAVDAGLPEIWLLGWSFGTELTLRWGLLPGVQGGILLSPPLRRARDQDLDDWAASGRPLTALVPEFDDYLRPDEARQRFARVPKADVIGVTAPSTCGWGRTTSASCSARSSGRSTRPRCTRPGPANRMGR